MCSSHDCPDPVREGHRPAQLDVRQVRADGARLPAPDQGPHPALSHAAAPDPGQGGFLITRDSLTQCRLLPERL